MTDSVESLLVESQCDAATDVTPDLSARDAAPIESLAGSDPSAAPAMRLAVEPRDAPTASDAPPEERDQGAHENLDDAVSLRDVERFLRTHGLTRTQARSAVSAVKRLSVPGPDPEFDALAAVAKRLAAVLEYKK